MFFMMILSILKKFLKICTFLWMLTSARRSWVQQRYLNLSLCAQNIFSYIFCLRGRLPSLPWVFYIITQWSCSTTGSLWEMPDSNWDFCPRSLVCYQWATTSPKYCFTATWLLKVVQLPAIRSTFIYLVTMHVAAMCLESKYWPHSRQS